MDQSDKPQTMTVPEAGAHYFGLSRNGAYQAAARGGEFLLFASANSSKCPLF